MNILGYPLDRAAAILERAGYRVETVEARSRKGVDEQAVRRRVLQDLRDLRHAQFDQAARPLRAEDAADAESTH